jgi:hypothetical protein
LKKRIVPRTVLVPFIVVTVPTVPFVVFLADRDES